MKYRSSKGARSAASRLALPLVFVLAGCRGCTHDDRDVRIAEAVTRAATPTPLDALELQRIAGMVQRNEQDEIDPTAVYVVDGVVSGIRVEYSRDEYDVEGKVQLTLKAAAAKSTRVECFFALDKEELVRALGIGDEVRLRGKFDSAAFGSVKLLGCALE